jgi:hypothetical protein
MAWSTLSTVLALGALLAPALLTASLRPAPREPADPEGE